MPKPELTTSIIEWIEENRSLIDSLKLDQVYKSGDYRSRPFLTYSLLKIGINPLKALTKMPINFARNLDITGIEIPRHITEIAESAFYGCSRLTGISLHNGITSIGSYAFYNCSSLTSVTIGNGLTSIGWGVFYGCSELKNITYTGTIEDWNDVSKGSAWNEKVPSTCVIHCIDGDILI